MRCRLLFGTILLLLAGCGQDQPMFVLLPEKATGVGFQNTVLPTESLNLINFRYFYNGGGVAVGDVNNDGRVDLYFTGNMVSSRLYLNRGGMEFEDVTEASAAGTQDWATGVSLIDINRDGWLDIHVSVSGSARASRRKNRLFINQGTNPQGVPTFREMAAAYGLDDDGYTTHAAFFDYDKDGDEDVYLLTAANSGFYGNVIRQPAEGGESVTTDRLYRNEGIGPLGHPVFRDVSTEAGIVSEGFGLGVSISDLNEDGWPDVYVSNDYLSSDLLYVNNRDGTFSEQARRYLAHQSYFAMGNDIADLNNDALPDIVTLDMRPPYRETRMMMVGPMNYERFQLALDKGYAPQYMRNTLQLNRGMNGAGQPTFSEIGQLSGIHQTDWSWSPLIADFDNDGHKDIHVTNGYVKDITNADFVAYWMPEALQIFNPGKRAEKIAELYRTLPELKQTNFVFRNTGDLRFSDKTRDWGLDRPSFSNGAAYADLDQDGDLDLVVNNINDRAFIYENRASNLENPHHYLRVNFPPAPHGAARGAKITIRHGEKLQTYERYPYRGYQSTVEDVAHFGLGADSVVDKLTVTWSDGGRQELTGVKAGQTISLTYAPTEQAPPADTHVPYWKETSLSRNIRYLHEENDFVDFNVQPLVPHMYSRSGPGLAVGDVNGDGREDFLVGGALGQNAAFFYQQPDGTFTQQPLADSLYEDTGALLFDVDQDQDLDLYLVSGGGAYPAGSRYYQDRLYINRGNDQRSYAQFELQPVPPTTSSGSCIVAADYDRDGDLDVFVGGRVVPHQYPLPPRSYLLNNEQGTLVEATPLELREIGMVNAGLWTDFNNDGWVDLIVAGEWMPLAFFKNDRGTLVRCDECEVVKATDGHFSEVNTSGWWNSLVSGDFDGDGDVDYVAGNRGWNSAYHASAQQPLTIFAKDFDENGTTEAVIVGFQQNEQQRFAEFPIHERDVMTRQMVALRRRFPRYSDYASATINQVLTPQEREGAYRAESREFSSSYIENIGSDASGTHRFVIKPLPVEAQFAPVFGLLAEDVDQDGNLDILLSGNSYSPQVRDGRYDALAGLMLRGNGKGDFAPVGLPESGFYLPGDGKALVKLSTPTGELVIGSRNSDSVLAFEQDPERQSASEEVLEIVPYPQESKAEVLLTDGRTLTRELTYGSGYLSQSSRILRLNKHLIRSVVIYDYSGGRREMVFQETGDDPGSK